MLVMLGHSLMGRTGYGTGLLGLTRVASLVLLGRAVVGRRGCRIGLLGLMRVA